MKIIGMTVKDQIARIAAPVSVVFLMKKWVQVADEGFNQLRLPEERGAG